MQQQLVDARGREAAGRMGQDSRLDDALREPTSGRDGGGQPGAHPLARGQSAPGIAYEQPDLMTRLLLGQHDLAGGR